jgi:hypothetical protein
MIHSDNIGELAKALAAAQDEIEDAHEDATNPHFRSRYATLASVRKAIRKPLVKNGLAYSQLIEDGDGGVAITTILMHSSGQHISSTHTMPVDKRTAQAEGSAITYGRRYALSALVGIATDDDDGNEATSNPPRVGPPSLKSSEAKAVEASPPPPPFEITSKGKHSGYLQAKGRTGEPPWEPRR